MIQLSRLISDNFDSQQAKVWSQELYRIRNSTDKTAMVVSGTSSSDTTQKIISSKGVISNSNYLSNRFVYTGQIVPKKNSGATDLTPVNRRFRGSRLSTIEEQEEDKIYLLDFEVVFINFFQNVPSSINNSTIITDIPLSEVTIIPPAGLPATTRFKIPLSRNSVRFSRGSRQENSYLEAGYDPNLPLAANINNNYRGMRLGFVGLRDSSPANFEIAIAAGDPFPNSQGGWQARPGTPVTFSQIQVLGAPEMQFPEYRVSISESPDPENIPMTGVAMRVKVGDLYERQVI